MRDRKPYHPGRDGPQAQIHDRRAKDINRGTVSHVVETEIDDPYETGARISAIRSTRDDPLADQRARGHIDEAQFLAGRQFQRDFGIAERGPRAIALSEAVDGGLPAESLTDAQLKAAKVLARCHAVLGRDGSTLAHDMLIRSMTLRQISIARGMPGREWEKYLGRRIHEVLNCLAVTYGFASEETKYGRKS